MCLCIYLGLNRLRSLGPNKACLFRVDCFSQSGKDHGRHRCIQNFGVLWRVPWLPNLPLDKGLGAYLEGKTTPLRNFRFDLLAFAVGEDPFFSGWGVRYLVGCYIPQNTWFANRDLDWFESTAGPQLTSLFEKVKPKGHL